MLVIRSCFEFKNGKTVFIVFTIKMRAQRFLKRLFNVSRRAIWVSFWQAAQTPTLGAGIYEQITNTFWRAFRFCTSRRMRKMGANRGFSKFNAKLFRASTFIN